MHALEYCRSITAHYWHSVVESDYMEVHLATINITALVTLHQAALPLTYTMCFSSGAEY
jgi:hypothetical protein